MFEEHEHELEHVRRYRAAVAEPDAATVSAARVELMKAIAREPHAPVRERLAKLQRRRRFALAGGLATAGLGIAGALGLSTATAPVSALAAQMNQLATVAASQDWSGIPGPGQYLYTESQGLTEADTMGNDQECAISQVEHRQIWIATDGSGALNDTRDQGKFTSPADQATCASAFKITDPSSQDSSSSSRFPAGGLSFPTNDWRSLSTDPQTLLKQIHARDGGPDSSAELFTNVGDYMREADVPPAIRAALYNAAALIPGVKLLGTQTDPTGQTGLGVGYPYDGGQIHSELIFDEQTGRLLAVEYYDQTGKLVDWTSYTSQRIVDSVPSYPLQTNPATTTTATGTATTPG
jgi:RNA polymerase sigma-70 factor (ECF subfamily)